MVNIIGRSLNPQGQPFTEPFKVWLVDYGTEASTNTIYASNSPLTVTPDEEGNFSFDVWASDKSDVLCYYRVKFNYGLTLKIRVPNSSQPLEFTDLIVDSDLDTSPGVLQRLTLIEANLGLGSGGTNFTPRDFSLGGLLSSDPVTFDGSSDVVLTATGVTLPAITTGFGLMEASYDGSQAVEINVDPDAVVFHSDPALEDAREWIAPTVTQVEAQSSSNTERFAWTPQRVWQAISAWWLGSSDKIKLDSIEAGADISPVQSVAGRIGDVSLSPLDIGLENVPNIDPTDASNITSGTLGLDRLPSGIQADTLATPRNINGVPFDGSQDITITADGNNGVLDEDGIYSITANAEQFNSLIRANETERLRLQVYQSGQVAAYVTLFGNVAGNNGVIEFGTIRGKSYESTAWENKFFKRLVADDEANSMSPTHPASIQCKGGLSVAKRLFADEVQVASPPSINGIPFNLNDDITLPVVEESDSRLTDSREWVAPTVTQVEAETGTSGQRRAWTPLRVIQAIAAWWSGNPDKTKLDGIEIGAQANTITSVNGQTGNVNITEVATATSLSTPRNINGVPFDGTSNISVATQGTLTPGSGLLGTAFDGSANRTFNIDTDTVLTLGGTQSTTGNKFINTENGDFALVDSTGDVSNYFWARPSTNELLIGSTAAIPTFRSRVLLNNGTNSTSNTTGALVVNNQTGIGGGNINTSGTITAGAIQLAPLPGGGSMSVLSRYPSSFSDTSHVEQGAYYSWGATNASDAIGVNGATEFINARGLGIGGFKWYNKVDGQAPTLLMGVNNGGGFSCSGHIVANTQLILKDPDTGNRGFLRIDPNNMYLLVDRDANGGWEQPHPIRLNYSSNTAQIFDFNVWTNGTMPVETGTFTPRVRNFATNEQPTYSAQFGQYTRIGHLVRFTIRVVITAVPASSTNGWVVVDNLPFARTSSLAEYDAVSMFSWNCFNGQQTSIVTAGITSSEPYIRFFVPITTGGGVTPVNYFGLQGGWLRLSGIYQTSAS